VTKRASRVFALAAAVSVASLASNLACSGDSAPSASSGSGASCPDDLPAACPTVAPSYAMDVAPVIQQACTPCHAPGGQQANRPLVTYAGFSNRSAMLNQVHACRMPPVGSPALPAAERKVLQEWLVCGAPND
jgi:hypothetical protein